MKVTLRAEPQWNLAITQILKNRGIKNIDDYLETGIENVAPPEDLGEDLLKQGMKMLVNHIAANDPVLVIIDADADGYTSSALLINYLHDLFPSFVENNLNWFIHQGKQHGLNDCLEECKKYKMILVPDAGSNDVEQHHILRELGIDILVLDHHIVDKESKDAIVIINNQNSAYPNKEISGVAVTWLFCRYFDKINNTNYADNYLDLVALGCMADMMSLASAQTKAIIFEGFKEKNIKNPFIYSMAEKNNYSLNKSDYKPSDMNELKFSPIGAAFFIIPFVNAMVRSGTQEEKELLFNSMLNFKAFNMILSTKRGHKINEEEQLVTQAVRTCTNVKNRQTKAEKAGLEYLEHLIEENNMLKHKVLLFLLEPGEVDSNIAGLIANRFMSKYQRPVCILTKVEEVEPKYATDKKGNKVMAFPFKKISYQGSARGYDASGITNFKDICAAAPGCIFTAGHQGAFGLGLGYDYTDERAEANGEWLYQFLDYTDEALKDMSDEPSYFVDYIWDYNEIDGNKILQIADMNDYIGKDLDRALVYIKNIPVNSDSFKVMKSNTLRIICPTADIIRFGATDEEIEELSTGRYKMNAVCKCAANEWNGAIDPQLVLVDYELIKEKPNVVLDWGF